MTDTTPDASGGPGGPTRFSVLIPARLGSTRLPEKALADLAGVPMVVRVARAAASSGAERVAVATDSEQIAAVVSDAGFVAVMTDPHHPSGTDRLAQASEKMGLADDEIVVNLQGDEPLMPPAVCQRVAQCLAGRGDNVMATAVYPITDEAVFSDPNAVKAVIGADDQALYFSRASVPYCRATANRWPGSHADPVHWHHLGIYAYRVAFLRRFVTLPVSPLETIEALEQLRVLWYGYRIGAVKLDFAPPPAIDTEHDLRRVRQILQSSQAP